MLTEGLHLAGLEPAPLEIAPKRSLAIKLPLLMVEIISNLRPIEIGVTNRIRTGTNAFTGRDAAVTS